MNNEFEKYDAFVKQMEERFPKMFAEPYGGFAVGAGWWPILTNLCANIQHHIDWKNKNSEVVPQVTVNQIKEKFGGLRFYYSGGDDTIDGMVRMAEAWAGNSCEECGAPGESRQGGWIKTRCDHHEDVYQANKRQIIMPKKINKIVIVGGGSAGWMAAATLVKFYPNKQISVIESPNVPIVGVGESTLGSIRSWMRNLEIDESDFMKYTNASYKMSIKFTDFYDKDYGSFHYPFGRAVLDDADGGLNEWQMKKALYPETPVEDYCRTYFSTMSVIEQNKFTLDTKHELDMYKSGSNVAYHFDATLFGRWLRDHYCIPKGVVHISKNIKDVKTNDDGIEKLIIDDETEITADLYVDCSGWKSMLLGTALNEPFTSFSDILPNNKAWAVQLPYKDKEKEIEPFTNCTAIGHGWVWNIPLWTRLGTGYVYSNKFISDADALEEYKQHLTSSKMVVSRTREEVDALTYKNIDMRIGIHERTFVKNVVAIGLSAGFIEPLESTGLFTVHEFLNLLINVLEKEHINQWDKDIYNTSTLDMFNNLAEFVAMHYAMSVRDDTNYWQHISKKTFSPGMVKQEPTVRKGFHDMSIKKMFNRSHDEVGGIHCIATGMNQFTMNRLNLLYAKNTANYDIKFHIDRFVANRKQLQNKWQKVADAAPTLYQYLKDNVHYENQTGQ